MLTVWWFVVRPVRLLCRTAFSHGGHVLLKQTPPLHRLLAMEGLRLPQCVTSMLQADGLSAPTFEPAQRASRMGGEAGAAVQLRVTIQDASRCALSDLQAGKPQAGVTSTEDERQKLAKILTDAVRAATTPMGQAHTFRVRQETHPTLPETHPSWLPLAARPSDLRLAACALPSRNATAGALAGCCAARLCDVGARRQAGRRLHLQAVARQFGRRLREHAILLCRACHHTPDAICSLQAATG